MGKILRKSRSLPNRNLHRVIIGKLHGVTICRELMHADQINKFEHVGQIDRAFWAPIPYAATLREPPAAWTSIPLGKCRQAILRNTPGKILRKSRSLPKSETYTVSSSAKLHGVTICRELEHFDQLIKSEHIGTDRSRFLRTHPVRRRSYCPHGATAVRRASDAPASASPPLRPPSAKSNRRLHLQWLPAPSTAGGCGGEARGKVSGREWQRSLQVRGELLQPAKNGRIL